MQMLRGVLEKSGPHVMVLHTIQRDGLETAPPHGEDERIPRLEDAAVPSVLLKSHLGRENKLDDQYK